MNAAKIGQILGIMDVFDPKVRQLRNDRSKEKCREGFLRKHSDRIETKKKIRKPSCTGQEASVARGSWAGMHERC